MNIMTFNTQHCLNFTERKIDFQIMADTISHCHADIVGLNEIRGAGEHPEYQSQTEILSTLTNMPYWYFAKAIDVGGRNPYGNALLSRYPIAQAETIIIPDPEPKRPSSQYETRCILKAKLDNGLTVLVVHFGLSREEQENAMASVLQHIEKEKCILMGDFNTTPDDNLLYPLRLRLNDAAQKFESPMYSFPSNDPVIKIDYIFTSKDIRVTASDIPAVVASDHRPHTAHIVIEEKAQCQQEG